MSVSRAAMPREVLAAPQERADIPPHVIRQLLQVVQERGHAPGRLCNGLGFTLQDLLESDLRISYRQARLAVLRAMRLLDDPALGLATGARQTAVSWGLPGLGMMSCPTLGAAIDYAIKYQREAGALTRASAGVDAHCLFIECAPRFEEPELEPFFVEEMLASALAVGRFLAGAQLRPLRVELRYPRPPYAAQLRRYFACAVEFGAPASRMRFARAWLAHPLPTYDACMQGSVQRQIDGALRSEAPQDDFLESVSQRLRAALPEMPALGQLAAAMNQSERSLRRRLAERDASYQALADRIRYDCALDLLRRTQLPLQGIALATGFSDARNFRRAFKRWSGVLPNELRRVDQRAA